MSARRWKILSADTAVEQDDCNREVGAKTAKDMDNWLVSLQEVGSLALPRLEAGTSEEGGGGCSSFVILCFSVRVSGMSWCPVTARLAMAVALPEGCCFCRFYSETVTCFPLNEALSSRVGEWCTAH